ncbi:hypothetical protein [Francisella philomiragia]|uniref:hypothetical protein n=1 Tax=Francisella philomiragia TaxID=28110 RepID=UPI0035165068
MEYKKNYNIWNLSNNLTKIYNKALSNGQITPLITPFKTNKIRSFSNLKLSPSEHILALSNSLCFGNAIMWGYYYLNNRLKKYYEIMDILTSDIINLVDFEDELYSFISTLINVHSRNMRVTEDLEYINKRLHIPGMLSFSDYGIILKKECSEKLSSFFNRVKEVFQTNPDPCFGLIYSSCHTIPFVIEDNIIILFEANYNYSRNIKYDNNKGIFKLSIDEDLESLLEFFHMSLPGGVIIISKYNSINQTIKNKNLSNINNHDLIFISKIVKNIFNLDFKISDIDLIITYSLRVLDKSLKNADISMFQSVNQASKFMRVLYKMIKVISCDKYYTEVLTDIVKWSCLQQLLLRTFPHTVDENGLHCNKESQRIDIFRIALAKKLFHKDKLDNNFIMHISENMLSEYSNSLSNSESQDRNRMRYNSMSMSRNSSLSLEHSELSNEHRNRNDSIKISRNSSSSSLIELNNHQVSDISLDNSINTSRNYSIFSRHSSDSNNSRNRMRYNSMSMSRDSSLSLEHPEVSNESMYILNQTELSNESMYILNQTELSNESMYILNQTELSNDLNNLVDLLDSYSQ